MIELIISVYFLFAKLLNHIHILGAGMIQIRIILSYLFKVG